MGYDSDSGIKENRPNKRKLKPEPEDATLTTTLGQLVRSVPDTRRRKKNKVGRKKGVNSEDVAERAAPVRDPLSDVSKAKAPEAPPQAPTGDSSADDGFPGDLPATTSASGTTSTTTSKTVDANVQEQVPDLSCPMCRMQFETEEKLRDHKMIPHYFKCSMCTSLFCTKEQLKEHKDTHDGPIAQFISVNGELVQNPDALPGARKAGKKLGTWSRFEGNGTNGHTNRNSFRRKRWVKNQKWSKTDTETFYTLLSQYGCNFELLSVLLKGRSRKQIKNKYKKEEKANPKRLKKALFKKGPLTHSLEEFQRLVKINLQHKMDMQSKHEGFDDNERNGVRIDNRGIGMAMGIANVFATGLSQTDNTDISAKDEDEFDPFSD